MENQNKTYYQVKQVYLANSLSFLGFRYYKFNTYENEQIYSFEDTTEFREALTTMCKLKTKYNIHYNN